MLISAVTATDTLSVLKKARLSASLKRAVQQKGYGYKIHWKPDLEVFTDIDIQPEYFLDIMKRQAIVNAGIEFVFRNQNGKSFDTTSYNYVNGIVDHVAEVVGENGLSSIQHWETEVKTRDRDDKPEYKCKMDISVAFSNKVHLTEYYHNSSWLEHGGAPDKAVRNAFVYQIDSYLKQNNKYNKTESKIKYDDVEDSLVCVISSFQVFHHMKTRPKRRLQTRVFRTL